MKLDIDESLIEDLRDAAQMSKEQCGIAVAAASDAVDEPETAEESLRQMAKAYSNVRWLSNIVGRILCGKEVGS